MTERATQEAGHFHAVKFYETSASLCNIVAEFLSEGLILKHPALVIAVPEHRGLILDQLRTRHFDVDQMQSAGDLVMLDADEALAAFMIDGMPDAERFDAMAKVALAKTHRGQAARPVRAYGEMVDVLWKASQDVAAIRLEMLWNKLANNNDFSLLCGYSMGHFYKDAHLADIHRQHSHVLQGQHGSSDQARRTSRVN